MAGEKQPQERIKEAHRELDNLIGGGPVGDSIHRLRRPIQMEIQDKRRELFDAWEEIELSEPTKPFIPAPEGNQNDN